MIHFRPFLNTDAPLLTEIWRSHHPLRAMVQSMTTSLFEQHVLSKPYFDRLGLILAIENDHPVGFVHVGFGANRELDDVSVERAVVSMMMVSKSKVPDDSKRKDLALEMIQQAETYAREAGANSILGGGSFPNNPFYLGFYGGSRLPGIIAEDSFTVEAFQSSGYNVLQHFSIWQRDLAQFRTVANREQMQIRRSYNTRPEFDPPARSWWEACTLGHSERMKFELVDRSTGQACGELMFWDMQPLAAHWGVHASGLFDLYIQPEARRAGLATFLIGESLRQLREHGSTLAEVQTPSDDVAINGLLRKLGFEQVDKGVLFSKPLTVGES